MSVDEADGRPRRIDEISDESRRRILDAAEELFITKGFDRTSFVDIAGASGISRGSIPWHFQNKDGLLVAVVKRAVARNVAANAAPETLGFRGLLEELEPTLASPGAVPLLFMVLRNAMSADDPVHDEYVAYFRRTREELAAYVASRPPAERPSGRAEIDGLAGVLSGALLGLQFLACIDGEGSDLALGLDALATLVERAYGGAS